ncbi:MAG: hypothetical protein CMK07_11195 [Ponticaulis sp.]|nr:hypothetical protein [Ponticaulis sp.]
MPGDLMEIPRLSSKACPIVDRSEGYQRPMSEVSETSAVTRLVPGLTILVLLIMIAAAVFHVVTLSPPQHPSFSRENAPAAPDFSNTTSWLLRPTGERLGGWERPWPIDLIWFPDQPDGYLGGWNTPIDWSALDGQLSSEPWLQTSERTSYVAFSPRRRHVSSLSGSDEDKSLAEALEREDVLRATDYYLETDHLMRGIFVGGRGSGLSAAIDVVEMRLADTAPYDRLLGGIIISPMQTEDLPEDMPPWPACAETASEYPCILDLRGISEADAVVQQIDQTSKVFSQWLDGNVTKPAAPLPPMETIEFSPVRRPGETDD